MPTLPALLLLLPSLQPDTATMKLPVCLLACATLTLLLLAAAPPLAAAVECPFCKDGVPDRPEGACGPWGDGGNTGEDYGRHKGYCWTKCEGASKVPWLVPGSALLFGKEWCYTTDGRQVAQEGLPDFSDIGMGQPLVARDNRVPCATDEDCCLSWKCSSSCTV